MIFCHRIPVIVYNAFALMAQHQMTHLVSPAVHIIVRHWYCQIYLMPQATKALQMTAINGALYKKINFKNWHAFACLSKINTLNTKQTKNRKGI